MMSIGLVPVAAATAISAGVIRASGKLARSGSRADSSIDCHASCSSIHAAVPIAAMVATSSGVGPNVSLRAWCSTGLYLSGGIAEPGLAPGGATGVVTGGAEWPEWLEWRPLYGSSSSSYSSPRELPVVEPPEVEPLFAELRPALNRFRNWSSSDERSSNLRRGVYSDIRAPFALHREDLGTV